jgi:hypothetical protein
MLEAWSASSLFCQPGTTQLDVPRESQREGIAIAKKAGVYKGRKPSLIAEQVKEIRRRVEAGEQKTGLAPEYGVSRADVVLCASLGTAPGSRLEPHWGLVPPVYPMFACSPSASRSTLSS